MAVARFGAYKGWNRAEHIAYCLQLGIQFEKFEKYSNDSPWSTFFVDKLWQLNYWPEYPFEAENGSFPKYNKNYYSCEYYLKKNNIVIWNKKPVKKKKQNEEV